MTGAGAVRWRRLGLAVAVTVAVTAVLAPLVAGGQLGRLRAQLNDVQYPTGPVDERLVVVELPLAATEWTRSEHAALVDALADGGAVAIGYDVVLDAPRDDDPTFARAIREAGTVVLAGSATLSGEVVGGVARAVAVTTPAPPLADASAGVGTANVLVSRLDRNVREVPLVVERPDRRLVPALSLATVMVAEGLDPGAVTLQAGTGVGIGSRPVPTDEQRALEINWAVDWEAGRADVGSDVGVTPSQVLAGDVDLDGAVVVVGVADPLVDTFATPVDRTATPGVYVHANAVNTMLTNLYRSGPDASTTIAVVAVLSAVLAVAGMFLRLTWVPGLAVLLLVGWQAVVNLAFQTGRNLDNLWPNVAVLLAAAGVVGARYTTEVRERRRVAGLFRQYVPDRVADDLLASARLAAAAEGTRVDVTVLFCDLRGFTATAARLAPADVRAMLEVYYDHCTRIVHDHGGTVMQFVGDEVFAVFGTPLPQDDHARRAVDAARGMQGAADRINAELGGRDVDVAYGIGIHSGEVVAAHVGSRVHKQYAVVGTTVNVGARLCSLAGPGEIVLSRATRDLLPTTPAVDALAPVTLKGVTEDPEPARLRQ